MIIANLLRLLSCFYILLLLIRPFVNSQYSPGDDPDSGTPSIAIPPVVSPRTCNGTDLTIRTFDGSCNNLKHSNWGTKNRVYDRGYFPAVYADSFSGEPLSMIDARLISNMLCDSGQEPVFSGSPLTDDTLSSTRKSIFEIFFGQFINHDLENAALSDGLPGIVIGDITNDTVFATNNLFNPTKSPYMTLSLSLGRVLNGTLYPVNKANSYLDLSNIYGDDEDTNTKLRNGPYLLLIDRPGDGGVYNKELKDITVHQIPPSFNETGLVADLTPPSIDSDEALVSGDLRCSENIQLCLIHTIWIREHNYWVDQMKNRPEIKDNDENLFQQARRIVIAEYQRIIFEEYLPAVLGFDMPPYTGYDETVYIDTSTHFAGAAFRYGHSNVRPYDLIDGCTGKPIVVHPDFQLPNSHPNRFYFVGKTVGFPPSGNPQNFTKQQLDYTPIRMLSLASGTHGNGVDNVLLSMLRGTAAEFDLMVSSSLRNIPGASDMVSVDVGRGRLLGLLDYNSYRAVYHPAGDIYANSQCDISAPQDSLTCFQLITTNTTVAQRLQTIYGKVNRIDAIIGMFAESKTGPTQPLPPTITNILKEEFNRKRIADRFWYEGSTYTDEEKTMIKNTSMVNIIERNTGVRNIQPNPFKSPGINDPLANVVDCPAN